MNLEPPERAAAPVDEVAEQFLLAGPIGLVFIAELSQMLAVCLVVDSAQTGTERSPGVAGMRAHLSCRICRCLGDPEATTLSSLDAVDLDVARRLSL